KLVHDRIRCFCRCDDRRPGDSIETGNSCLRDRWDVGGGRPAAKRGHTERHQLSFPDRGERRDGVREHQRHVSRNNASCRWRIALVGLLPCAHVSTWLYPACANLELLGLRSILLHGALPSSIPMIGTLSGTPARRSLWPAALAPLGWRRAPRA